MPRIALLGGAHIHTPNFVKKLAETPGIETVAVYDPDPAVAGRRAEVTGGETVADPADALGEDVDAVVITSQTDRHEQLVLAAAAAGKHLFVEKPLGMDHDDALRMAAAIEKAGVLFQTGYFMRGQPPVQHLRSLIREGKLGTPTRLRLSNCHAGAYKGIFDGEFGWMADPKQAGCGAFGDLGTHVLDLLLWFLEDDEVLGCTASVGNASGKYACDDHGIGLVRFASGAVASLSAGWVDHADPMRIEVSGTEGHAHLRGGQLYLAGGGLGDGSTPVTADDMPPAWPHAFDNFLAAVKGDDHPPLVTVREAALRNAVMDALYHAAEQQAWLPPERETTE